MGATPPDGLPTLGRPLVGPNGTRMWPWFRFSPARPRATPADAGARVIAHDQLDDKGRPGRMIVCRVCDGDGVVYGPARRRIPCPACGELGRVHDPYPPR